MRKFFAVLRTVVLVLVLVMALISTPFEVFGSADSMVAVKGIRALVRATWIAIAWIALETGIGWLLALRKPKGAPPRGDAAAKPTASAPPAEKTPPAAPSA
jgi:hypothetical protein